MGALAFAEAGPRDVGNGAGVQRFAVAAGKRRFSRYGTWTRAVAVVRAACAQEACVVWAEPVRTCARARAQEKIHKIPRGDPGIASGGADSMVLSPTCADVRGRTVREAGR